MRSSARRGLLRHNQVLINFFGMRHAVFNAAFRNLVEKDALNIFIDTFQFARLYVQQLLPLPDQGQLQ